MHHVWKNFTVARALGALAILFVSSLNAAAMEGNLKQFTLPNGLEVIVKEDRARKVASIQLWVMVGSADEEKSEIGISHLIEHMAFKGTERRGVGVIAAEVEALGGDTNAYTSWDETVFHVTVPSSAVAQGIDIVTDAVLRPVIDPGELEKEKQVVIEEILEGDERPERKASKLLFDTAYKASPYRYPVIGFKDVVAGFTRDNVVDFRKKWYVPENMFLVVVGDVDAQAVKGEVERLTADLKPRGFFRPPRAVEPIQKEIRSAMLKDANARETRIHVAFHIPSMQGNDVNALDLAADILGSRDSSRLVRVLKKEKGLVNSISAYAVTPKEPGLMVVSATLDAKNLEATVRGIMEEISALGKQPPSGEELRRARVHIESQQVYAWETVQGTARSIGSYRADLGDPYYAEKYLRLNEAVTGEQVSEVVQRYLAPPNVTISLLVPEGDAQGVKTESLVSVIKSFAERTGDASAGPLAKEKVLTGTLPNGIRVVLQRDAANPVVAFRIAHLGGKRFENKTNEGIINFISQMLNKGTTTLSEVEIARKIEDMGGRISGFSGYDSFGISASFFSRYLDEGLKLLADLDLNPAFPKEQMDRERNLIINRIKTEPDRPVGFTINNLNATVFPRHPYGFVKEGTIETVSGFTADDLMQTYRRFAVPSNTVITGVGDMNTEKVMGRLTEIFGKTPAKPLDAPDIPAEEGLKDVREKIVRIPRAKAHVAIGFIGTTLADADRYPLEVLNNILAGQGGRLFVQLRDKESLAYSVTSFVRPGLDRGIFAFYIGCDVAKADQATKSLFREIKTVRESLVSDEELKRSITNLTGNHLIALQTTWARAENSALNTVYGLGYDFDVEYLKKIAEVKAEDVKRVASKYLDPKRCALVKILPEEEKK